MENKKLVCKNCDCSNNSEYKTKNKDKGTCKVFTEEILKNRTYCAEREW